MSPNTPPASTEPWDLIPNPFGFPTAAEAARRALPHPFSGPHYDSQGVPIVRPQLPVRSSPVGRDWLGRGFVAGDTVLGQSAGTQKLFEVEEIFLDDRGGVPLTIPDGDHLAPRSFLVLDESTKEILKGEYRDSSEIEVQLVHPEWILPGLGVLTSGSPYLPKGVKKVQLQNAKVRCRPLDGGRRVILLQRQLTAVDLPMDRSTLKLHMDANRIPLIGPPRVVKDRS